MHGVYSEIRIARRVTQNDPKFAWEIPKKGMRWSCVNRQSTKEQLGGET